MGRPPTPAPPQSGFWEGFCGSFAAIKTPFTGWPPPPLVGAGARSGISLNKCIRTNQGVVWAVEDGPNDVRTERVAMSSSRPPTNYRAFRRRNDRNLALAVVIFLVGVGGALIAAIYGSAALILGLTCLLAGSAVFGLLWLILTLMERWAGE